MIHKEKSELAGKTVRIKKHVEHRQYSDFGGSEFIVEDWLDRINGKSWMGCLNRPACLIYACRLMIRSSMLPIDDEVLYGHRKDGLGSLVHISELEIGDLNEC